MVEILEEPTKTLPLVLKESDHTRLKNVARALGLSMKAFVLRAVDEAEKTNNTPFRFLERMEHMIGKLKDGLSSVKEDIKTTNKNVKTLGAGLRELNKRVDGLSKKVDANTNRVPP